MLPSSPPHVSARSLADQVTDQVRHALLGGGYLPGSRINEVELASRFGVSRGPVREALQRLGAEGLVQHVANRGALVPVPTHARVRALFELREALEVGAVRLAAARRTDGDIDALEEICQASTLAYDGSERFPYGLDLAFHDRVVVAAASPLLAEQVGHVMRQVVMLRSWLTVPETHTHQSIHDHQELTSLIASQQAERAAELTRRHLGLVSEHLLQALAARPQEEMK